MGAQLVVVALTLIAMLAGLTLGVWHLVRKWDMFQAAIITLLFAVPK